MRLSEPVPGGERLNEPSRRSDGRHSAHRGGARLSGILTGGLLVLLGFLIAALLGVVTGLISPGQLVTLFAGNDSAPPPALSAPATTTAAEASSPAPATPDVAATPQPRVVLEKTFGDWRFSCVETTQGVAPTCSAVQQLRVAETGAAAFIWRIVRDVNGGLVGIWQVPDAVLLTAGLTLDAGTPKPLIIPFESCGGGSCRVVANLAPDFIAALLGAKTLSAGVVLSNRQGVKFPLSANGLGDALVALQQ